MRAVWIWASIATGSAIVAAAMVVAYHAPGRVRGPQDTFLIGPFDPTWTFGVSAAVVVVALCGTLIAGWWRAVSRGMRILLGFWSVVGVLLAIPLLAVIGFFALLASGPYTEIPASVAGRDLVVREFGLLRAGGAYVYERHGAALHWVATLPAAGDALQPFASGDYDVVRSGDHVVLRWTTEDPPGSAWFRLA